MAIKPRIRNNTRKISVPTEHQEQVAFVNWFEWRHNDVKLFAIPNGGSRNKIEAKNLKLEGVRSGVPDLMIPEWFLFIEMKRQKGGRVFKEQKEWHDYLRPIGYTVAICKGFAEAKEYIIQFVDAGLHRVEITRGQNCG